MQPDRTLTGPPWSSRYLLLAVASFAGLAAGVLLAPGSLPLVVATTLTVSAAAGWWGDRFLCWCRPDWTGRSR